jgi:hypothetical protein
MSVHVGKNFWSGVQYVGIEQKFTVLYWAKAKFTLLQAAELK